jgi:hypothetical protein
MNNLSREAQEVLQRLQGREFILIGYFTLVGLKNIVQQTIGNITITLHPDGPIIAVTNPHAAGDSDIYLAESEEQLEDMDRCMKLSPGHTLQLRAPRVYIGKKI